MNKKGMKHLNRSDIGTKICARNQGNSGHKIHVVMVRSESRCDGQ